MSAWKIGFRNFSFSLLIVSLVPHASDAQLSLRRKIGQMVMVTFVGDSLEKSSASLDTMKSDLANGSVGGIIMFTWSNNLRRPEQITHLTGELQRRSSLPLFLATDEEGGQVARLGSSNGFASTPSAYRMGTTINTETYTRSTASTMAGWFIQSGLNVDFAPVADVDVNPSSPAIGALDRSFSPNPNTMASHAKWFIDEFHKRNLLTTLKHFPGHGSAKADSHLGLVDITKTWADSELVPYRKLLSDGMVDLIMTAHVFNANLDSVYPATLSNKVVNGLLRQSLGYQGVVISDEMSMQAIVDFYGFDEAIILAVKAGVDILLYNKNLDDAGGSLSRHVVDLIERNVQDGTLTAGRIDESFNRIMSLKQRVLVDVPHIALASLPTEFNLSNYPNPFNSTTTIAVQTPEAQHVSLKVFDLLGREISTLIDDELPAGTRLISWKANTVSSGVYIAQLRTNRHTKSIKMLLLK